MALVDRSERPRLAALAAAGAVALLVAACGGAGTAAPAATRATTTGAPPPGATAAGSGQPVATPPAATAAVRVSANRATRAQLQQAFEAAGIPNAARMAVEVEEYRPYPTTDPGFAKLRQELSKYNIPVAVVDQIVATLTLD